MFNAVHLGLVTEAEIDTALRRAFLKRFKLGMFDPPERVRWAQIPYRVNQSPELLDEEPHLPLFHRPGALPVRYGLSYTKFAYSGARVDRSSVPAERTVSATVTVKNVGKRAGDEVVQLYLKPLDPKRERALRALRGIQRVSLKPGQSREVTFTIEPDRDLTICDDVKKSYAVDPGRFEVEFAASSADVRAQTLLEVN